MELLVVRTIDQSKRFLELGSAQEALEELKVLLLLQLMPQEKRAVASLKFDILWAQGYYRRAETVVRKAIAVSSNELWARKSEEELWMHILLRAKRALAIVHTTGKTTLALRLQKELIGIVDHIGKYSLVLVYHEGDKHTLTE